MYLNLFHLYPEELNLYGDTGNIKAIIKRCKERNIGIKLNKFSTNKKSRLKKGDIFFIGGGSDVSQRIVYKDFLKYRNVLKQLIEKGKVVLAVCGGYQLLGKNYITTEGEEIPGLAIFNYESKQKESRIIGNIILKTSLDIEPKTIVGFENHGGRTYTDYEPLGEVIVGKGNDDSSLKEGVIYKNFIGTYLHGPILPKNPHLTDYLILKALKNKYNISSLKDIDSEIEFKAHNKFIKLYGNNKIEEYKSSD